MAFYLVDVGQQNKQSPHAFGATISAWEYTNLNFVNNGLVYLKKILNITRPYRKFFQNVPLRNRWKCTPGAFKI